MRQQATDPFQAIADPSRRAILQMLARDKLTINAVAENFDMSRPAVSKHIKILYTAGFISITETGRERYCSLRQEGFTALQQWMAYFEGFWTEKLNALELHLASAASAKQKKPKDKKLLSSKKKISKR